MKVTSKDVAREAGVSQTTVSLILNGRNLDSFPEETQNNVLFAAKKLGYIPSTAAKALRLGRNDIIVCLLPDLPVTTAMDEFKTMLSTRLSKAGLVCVFFHFAELKDELNDLWQRIRPALVIAFTELPDDDVIMLKNADIPCINGLFDRKSNGHSESGLDQYAIGALQAKHLLEKGYKNIVYVGIKDHREKLFCDARREGFITTCDKIKVRYQSIEIANYKEKDAFEALKNILPVKKSIGFAAFNDMTALSILSVMNTINIKIPADVGIIGVDNLPVSELAKPPLTSIELNLSVNAEYLSRKVIKILNKEKDIQPETEVKIVENALKIIHRETT